MDIFKLIAEVGFPIAGALASGFFVFFAKYILDSVSGSVKGLMVLLKHWTIEYKQ